MKQWAVISYVQQKRQKQGHLISPQIIEAETRREAKVKFKEKWLFVKVRGIYTRFSHLINGTAYVESCEKFTNR